MGKKYVDHPWVTLFRVETEPIEPHVTRIRRYSEWLLDQGIRLEDTTRHHVVSFVASLAGSKSRSDQSTGGRAVLRLYDFLEETGRVSTPSSAPKPAPPRQQLLELWATHEGLTGNADATVAGQEYLAYLDRQGLPVSASTWETVEQFQDSPNAPSTLTRRLMGSLQEFLVWHGYVTQISVIARPEYDRHPVIEALIAEENFSISNATAFRHYATWLNRTGRRLEETSIADADIFLEGSQSQPGLPRPRFAKGKLERLYRTLEKRGQVSAKLPTNAVDAAIARLSGGWRESVSAWNAEEFSMVDYRVRKARIVASVRFLVWLEAKGLEVGQIEERHLAAYIDENPVGVAQRRSINFFMKYLARRGVVAGEYRFEFHELGRKRAPMSVDLDPDEIAGRVQNALRAAMSVQEPGDRLTAVRAATVAMTILETGQRPGTIIAWSDLFFDLAGRRIVVPDKKGKVSFEISARLVEAIGIWRQEAAKQGHQLDPTMFREPSSDRKLEPTVNDPTSRAIRMLLSRANPDMAQPIKIHTLIAAYRATASAVEQ